MCDPVTLATLAATSVASASTSTVVAGASAAIGAASALTQASASAAAHKANAELYRNNAQIRDQRGVAEADAADRKYERAKGTVVSRIATTGIDPGSFGDILADDAQEAALEQAQIRANARNDSDNLRFQADNEKRMGKDAKIGGYLNAAGAVVGAFAPTLKSRNPASSSRGVAMSSSFDN